MKFDKDKLAKAIAAVWIFLSIPISEDLYDEVLDEGLFMRIFALAMTATPVWLVFGWQWLSDSSQMPAKIWASTVLLGVIVCTSFANHYDFDEIAYIPFLQSCVFLLMVWVYERESMKALLQKIFSPPAGN